MIKYRNFEAQDRTRTGSRKQEITQAQDHVERPPCCHCAQDHASTSAPPRVAHTAPVPDPGVGGARLVCCRHAAVERQGVGLKVDSYP